MFVLGHKFRKFINYLKNVDKVANKTSQECWSFNYCVLTEKNMMFQVCVG